MEVLTGLIKGKGIIMHYTPGTASHILYPESSGFTVTLSYGEKQISFPFHMGMGEPKIEMVICYLLFRSEAIDLSYEKYCKEFDYEPNEIAKKMYQQDLEIGSMIKDFLEDDFEEFKEKNDY